MLADLVEGAGVGTFPISIEGTTARLFGPGAKAIDCVTVTVLTDVLATRLVATDVMLGGAADEVKEAVDDIETAGMILLLIEMAGAEVPREKR